jgi:hypothetical protein
MAPSQEVHRMSSFDKAKAAIERIEDPIDQYLQAFPLLRDRTHDDLEIIRRKLLRKLDWRFLPTVTVMLLMAQGFTSHEHQHY